MERKDIEEIAIKERYTLYNRQSESFPDDAENVDVIYENGSVGECIFWNVEEGFDAQTEPHHIEVIAWKRRHVYSPEVKRIFQQPMNQNEQKKQHSTAIETAILLLENQLSESDYTSDYNRGRTDALIRLRSEILNIIDPINCISDTDITNDMCPANGIDKKAFFFTYSTAAKFRRDIFHKDGTVKTVGPYNIFDAINGGVLDRFMEEAYPNISHVSDYLELMDLYHLTDEHAVEIAKICWKDDKLHTAKWGTTIAHKIANGSYDMRIGKMIQVVDFIRRSGYLIRFGKYNPESIISMGWCKIKLNVGTDGK